MYLNFRSPLENLAMGLMNFLEILVPRDEVTQFVITGKKAYITAKFQLLIGTKVLKKL